MVDDSESSAKRVAPARGRGVRTGGDKLTLAVAFGVDLLSGEQALWDAMSPEQRKTAITRIDALLRYENPRFASGGPLTAEEAAKHARLSQNRWYEMYAAWREKRSLASLGVAAAMPRTRTLSYHDDLQRLVPGVVDADPNGSVRRLALALGEAYGAETSLAQELWPTYNTLRKFVEAELRRRSKDDEPGSHVTFDCCACALPHSKDVFTAFLVIDRGSRAVLGGALGDASHSRAGYAAAARDALDRLRRDPLDRFAWAEDMAGSEIVIGLDDKDWSAHAEEMAAVGMKGQLQPATKARRFGAYVRPLIGQRMGRVKFMPGQTSKGQDFATPTPDDVRRFEVEIDFHNADLAPEMPGVKRQPPTKLISLLKRLRRS